ncbi:hypothetical protein pipiens_017318 [Culex pipiens pipiens]|uniref:K Homology domain-containing protein n=1 Tax=Culex pipiens pipiens TaxID=38569 RepID=A0ABD1CH76_CULPP
MRENGFVSGTDDVRFTVEILVPSAQVGRIIGKGGQNVRDLQRVTGSIIKQPEHTAAMHVHTSHVEKITACIQIETVTGSDEKPAAEPEKLEQRVQLDPDPKAVRNQLGESKKEAPETSKESAASSVKEESSLKSSEVDSCTASSALNTAEETNPYASNARKFNGISSTSGSELDDKSAVQTPANVTTTAASTRTTTTAANKLDPTQALTSEDALYEVSVWFDGAELQFLSVEKVIEDKLAVPGLAGSTQDLTGIDSSKQFSKGSVGSLGPFQLPSARPAADSHSSATDSSGTISSQSKAPLSKVKHTVRGAKALASLMIEEFTKIKRALSKDDELSNAELDQSSSNAKTPKTTTKKSEHQKAETGHTRTCRAGTASELGRTRTIVSHAVHALTYEAGFVDEVKRNETTNKVSYVVRIGEGTVELPSVNGKRGSATNTPILQTPEEASAAGGGEKGSRSTRSKRSNKIQVRDIPR